MLWMKRERDAFTLIELLVVIAIIALLLSIMLPSLKIVKMQAQSTVCKSNLRQMAMAAQFYTYDYNNKFLPFIEDIMSPEGKYWFHLLAPYLGDDYYSKDPVTGNAGVMKVSFCPSARKVDESLMVKYASTKVPCGPGTAKNAWRFWWGGEGSYGINCWLQPNGNWYIPSSDHDKFFDDNFTNIPPDTPILADSIWVGSWPYAAGRVPDDLYFGWFFDGPLYFMGRFCIDRHNMAVNAGFADGHSEKIPLAELWRLRWHKDFRPRYDIEIARSSGQ